MNYTEKARELRKKQTNSEIIFWEKVRNKKIGLKIVRQKPVLFNYLGSQHAFYADFYCKEKSLVIEIDGKIHDNQKEYDEHRNHVMNLLGLKVMRIKNEDIISNIEEVICKIHNS